VGIAHLCNAALKSGLANGVFVLAKGNLSALVQTAGGKHQFSGYLIIDKELIMAGLQGNPGF